jgi:hypothetical protein
MAFFRRITNLLRRPGLDREISEELQAHTATWIPARRALSVNPAQLLREE